jgi:hypothetical protein
MLALGLIAVIPIILQSWYLEKSKITLFSVGE